MEDVVTQSDLNKNQLAVLSVLVTSERPLGAYDILDLVRDRGVRSPLQVYRALKKLRELGLAHRIESRSAFVACNREPHSGAVCFLVCDQCGKATELPIPDLENGLVDHARSVGTATSRIYVEINGLCRACRHNEV